MAEWLRPGLWEVLTIKLRGIEPGQILIAKKPKREGCTEVMSPCNCGRRKPILEGRMAEWLRHQTSIAENGLNIRRISVGLISCPSKMSIGWAESVKITSRRYYGRRKPTFRGSGWPSG
jgi:hypothetical protein